MSTTTASLRAPPASDLGDWLNDPVELLEFLRARGYGVGLAELLRAVGMVERLAQAGLVCRPLTAAEAALWLAPILCSNEAEQSSLGPILSAYAAALRHSSEPEAPPTMRDINAAQHRVAAWVAGHRVRAATAFVAGASCALFLDWLLATRPNPSLFADAWHGWLGQIMLTSGLLLLLWLLGVCAQWLWSRRPVLRRIQGKEGQLHRQFIIGRVAKALLFDGQELCQALQALRSHRFVEGQRFDARRSVRATLAAAGRPVLVCGRRPRRRDYPIVTEELSGADHLSALARDLVKRLHAEHVDATLYAFSASPSRLRTAGVREAMTYEELHLRHGDDVLLLVGDGGMLWDALNGCVTSRALSLVRAWRAVVLLTPVPPRRWSWRERHLAAAEIIVLPAAPEGLELLSNFLRVGGEPPQPALMRAPMRPGVMTPGLGNALDWIRDYPVPSEHERATLLDS